MIEISLGAAVFLYAIVIAVGIALTWLFTEYATGRAFAALEQQDLWRCHFCTFTYLDRSGLGMSRCPRCQSFNVRDGGDAWRGPAPVEAAQDDAEAPRRNPSRRKRPGAGRRGPRRHR
jgi:ribosomal protein L37AE/L43A